MKKFKISLGPTLFNWQKDFWKDFYLKVADNPNLDEVYLGEVVCSKREVFYREELDEVMKILEAAGKKVYIATTLLVLGENDLETAKEFINKYSDKLAEVNEVSILSEFSGKNFIVGPGFNNYNKNTLKLLEEKGAQRFCFPYELDKKSIATLATATEKEKEVQVFGRVPLAISARCYSARMHHVPKIDCGYVCNLDLNGKKIKTLEGKDFLTINGTQTMSATYNNLILEALDLLEAGVNVFRISPHALDINSVINTFSEVLNQKITKEEGFTRLLKVLPAGEKYSNGFYYGIEGKKQLSSDIEIVE